jgi:hypothetical protein
MAEEGSHRGPTNLGAWHQVPFQIVGMDLHQARDQQIAIKVLANMRGATDDIDDQTILDLYAPVNYFICENDLSISER